MIHFLPFLPFLLIATAHAGPYLELGLAKADGASCITSDRQLGCSESPLGYASIGYEWKGFTAAVEHWSSLPDRHDYGLNLFSIKYRHRFFE